MCRVKVGRLWIAAESVQAPDSPLFSLCAALATAFQWPRESQELVRSVDFQVPPQI